MVELFTKEPKHCVFFMIGWRTPTNAHVLRSLIHPVRLPATESQVKLKFDLV
jgi:hypothetical protein